MITGNARFSSINAIKGFEQSRRDDLESISYLLIYFLRGNLPWQGIRVKNKREAFKKIYERKIRTSTEFLCFSYPSEFKEFVNYCKNLKFEENPNYDYLRSLLESVKKGSEGRFDNVFDWNEKKKPERYEYTEPESHRSKYERKREMIDEREKENKKKSKSVLMENNVMLLSKDSSADLPNINIISKSTNCQKHFREEGIESQKLINEPNKKVFKVDSNSTDLKTFDTEEKYVLPNAITPSNYCKFINNIQKGDCLRNNAQEAYKNKCFLGLGSTFPKHKSVSYVKEERDEFYKAARRLKACKTYQTSLKKSENSNKGNCTIL